MGFRRCAPGLILLMLLVAGCNLPNKEKATQAVLATKVAAMLTASPVPIHPTQTAPAGGGSPLPATILPSQTPLPTATATAAPPTETPTLAPSKTPPAEDPRQTLGNPNVKDDFSYDTGWYLYEDDQVKFSIKDNKLVMADKEAVPNYEKWGVHGPPALTNFYIEMTAKFGECSGMDRYGMLLRAPDPNHGYVLMITCDGRYSLRNWNGKEFVNLVKWTESERINAGSGQGNRLGLMARGDTLTVYINGGQVARVEDDAYSSGRYGPVIAAEQTQGFKATVSEVSYWILP
jgi:hypothetical protein